MTNVFFTCHDDGITLLKDGKQYTVSKTHPNYTKILNALKKRDFNDIDTLMSITNTINKNSNSKINPNYKVYVKDGKIYFSNTKNGTEELLAGPLVDRIIRDLENINTSKYVDSLMMLMHNIKKNKSKEISEELYQWLQSGRSPITSDGCILAYKKVATNFLDFYSSTMDNSPGSVVRMKQSDVDVNRNNECSTGLHFASLGYLSNYSNNADEKYKIVIVKVNPRHIFAIPKDYNCQKGRASEYFVVGEYTGKNRQTEEAFKDSFIDEDNMVASAPNVIFTKSRLKPSIKALAESYGIVKDGKVKVRSNSNKRVIVSWFDDDSKYELEYPKVDIMSFETKSIRDSVKSIIKKIEKSK